MGENSICNAVKLLSVGAPEKYMTALFILHSPVMLESMMAWGGRGPAPRRAPADAAALHVCAFTLQKVRRKQFRVTDLAAGALADACAELERVPL